MKVPFQLTKGSSLDLYSIVPGMSVVFSSTYNLNVTVSTKYSNLVYQSPEFSNETNSTRTNLKSVSFGASTGRLRVVALEDTYFVYETIRGDFDKNDTCIVKEANFTAEDNKQLVPPSHQNENLPGSPNEYYPGNHHRNQQPGDHDRYHQHPGDHDHYHQHPGDHDHYHQHPGGRNQNPPNHQQPNEPRYPGYQHRNNQNSSTFDNIFDSIFAFIVSIAFIALGIALVVSFIRACKRNRCCGYDNIDDASIPPIIEQTDTFEQYIPPHNGNNQSHKHAQQNVQQIPINYPQLSPVQPTQQSNQVPILVSTQQHNAQLLQPNYYYPHPYQMQTFAQGQQRPQ